MILFNKSTGVAFEVDPVYARIRRMQRRVFAWADALQDYLVNKDDYRLVMIGLTYREVGDWRVNHIRNFMLVLRKHCGVGLLAYAWVAELQERGAVHYHILVLVKRGTDLPKPDKAGYWPHGSTRVDRARSVFYICSYVGKEYQKSGEFPKGLRMFAVWISKSVDLATVRRFSFKSSSLPVWLGDRVKEHFEKTEEVLHARRRSGGGWQDDAGRVYASPWFQVFGENVEEWRSRVRPDVSSD